MRKTKKLKAAKMEVDVSTEQKIKEAARKVFTIKGYAGARTRDIAVEAGINLALLNYYFRSKEKLFQLIMLETVSQFIKGIKSVLTDETTSLKQKTETIASNYIDMLIQNPDLPVFMLSELRSHPEQLVEKVGIKDAFTKSVYLRQIKESAKAKGVAPLHYFMNTMAMLVFPFVARPIIKGVAGLGETEFISLMKERKLLIAKWIEAMLRQK